MNPPVTASHEATHTADLPENLTQKERVRQDISDNALFSTAYAIMNALATVVACYGLLQNSTAVVIGAMIIAMLLGPIAGIALALVDGDMPLLRKALLAEIEGVALVLGIAFVLGKIHQDLPLTNELLARTSPNILDLMIALAGGAAGAYATVEPRIKAGLVGVAIATALVPPLSTCGICLARGESRLAFGGFLLFFANFVAIQFASSVVLWLNGYHKMTRQPQDKGRFYRRNSISFALLLALAGFLGVNFSRSVTKQQYETHLHKSLEEALKKFPGVRLNSVRFQQESDIEVVYAVVVTPYSFSPERVAEIEDALPAPKKIRLELHLRAIITKETTRKGYVHELPSLPDENDADKVEQ